ncbi:MAG: molybdopterin synthase catalytic subunit [Thermoproteota archaeon]|jgi:molybdopterin synthase catalytic subunit
MFKVLNEDINNYDIEAKLKDPSVGAIVYFQGKVRNHNLGLKVTSLEYTSYIEMANKVGEKVVKEAIEKFDIVDAICIHRVGHLQIDDTAVWTAASSAHRGEAFRASEYIIDRVKTEVPIWKREHYVDKEPEWVACHHCEEYAKKSACSHKVNSLEI